MEIFDGCREKLCIGLMTGAALLVIVPTFAYVAFVMGRIIFALRSRTAFREFQEQTLARQILKFKVRQRNDEQRRKLGKASWSGLLIGSILLVAALAISVAAFEMLSNFISARNWNVADCTVASLRMQSTGKSPGGSRPQIVYRFKVGDESFTGSRYDFFNTAFDDSEAASIEKIHQPGNHFACFYDPANPRESVAARIAPRLSLPIMTIIGLLFFYSFGILFVYESLPIKRG